uniref:U2A'/phosphoprotein 32 family A C-terminal domain-containing protein n=1 Tax=Phytophthora ramorum TaxID=164328 RepID=H3HC05_PHYRM
MASFVRRGSVGLDGAESQYCDLSGRGLTSGQIDRTLRVFATAETIDLSNNEIDKVPTSIPAEVVTLDMSFNVIASIHGIERLKFVQELHLAFNRLNDVSALEFCPRLVRVNLSGNRLMYTKGLETLEYLETLDISDNLIESPEALRPLSLNQNLTHITIRGNPLSQKPGFHVPMLDMIPSLLMLDDKKMRTSTKYQTKEITSNGIHANRPITPPVKPILNSSPTPIKREGAGLLEPQSEGQHTTPRSQKSVAKLSNEGTRGASTPRHPPASRSAVARQERWQEPQQRQRRTQP